MYITMKVNYYETFLKMSQLHISQRISHSCLNSVHNTTDDHL